MVIVTRLAVAVLVAVPLAACGHYSFEPAVEDGGSDSGDGPRPDVPQMGSLQVWIDCADIANNTTLVDASGNNSTIQCAPGQCPTLTPGPRGQACLFDGIDDVVLVSPSARFMAPMFTAAAWARLDTTLRDTFGAIWIKHTTSIMFEVWALYVRDVGSIREVYLVGGSSSTDANTLVGDAVHGTWAHLAVTYDGSTFTIYRDGLPMRAVPVTPPVESMRELQLGAEYDEAQRASHFPGAIDDAMYFDRALTASEIAALARP